MICAITDDRLLGALHSVYLHVGSTTAASSNTHLHVPTGVPEVMVESLAKCWSSAFWQGIFPESNSESRHLD